MTEEQRKRLEEALRQIKERLGDKTVGKKDDANLPDLQPGHWEVLNRRFKL